MVVREDGDGLVARISKSRHTYVFGRKEQEQFSRPRAFRPRKYTFCSGVTRQRQDPHLISNFQDCGSECV